MTRQVFCLKLNQETEGLDSPPFPGPLGEKIFNQISKQAWKMWLDHQTMLINEYRLSLIDPKAREFLNEEMKNYFFGNGSEKPTGFTPKDRV
ncbi:MULTISPECIES: oxidative damage protection protein [unclassified Legionella]|uniref:oxidative damage protection protein n=1 Tax=unclassified Legionella TaxID=2622702 RepID=UPI00105526A4|nr:MULTISPECIES: oxidative damage protection protein [unclassified Legionella]MDI9818520.1 oxidative damage protection protein [Legionella sp. PL877]